MTKSTSKTHFYELPQECTIYEVSELKDALLAHIASDKNIEFDLSKVSLMDACIVQLLVATQKELKKKKLKFGISALSDYAQQFFSRMYCNEILFLCEEESSNG